jgi:hypothetical protein
VLTVSTSLPLSAACCCPWPCPGAGTVMAAALGLARATPPTDVNDAVFALVAFEPGGGFETLWNGFCALGKNPGVDAVDVTEDLITVHFNDQAGALCDLDQQGVDLRAQQLAWTVRTATGSDAPVAVTVGEDNLRVQGPVVADERYINPRVFRKLQRRGTLAN